MVGGGGGGRNGCWWFECVDGVVRYLGGAMLRPNAMRVGGRKVDDLHREAQKGRWNVETNEIN